MGLLSIFKRKRDASGALGAVAPGGVQQARARARQRLVGAVVLVVIGVIAFPLLFESRPRPIPVDIPIEIPRKEGAPALAMPPARAPAVVTESVPAVIRPGAPETKPPTTQKADATAPAGIAGPATAAAPSEPAPVAKPAQPKAAATEPTEAPKKPAAAVQAPADTSTAADAAKAKALLDGKAASAVRDAGRFVVQVGAFAEASAAQDTRAKIEKLGLKAHTQVTQTTAGNRIRVRLGPFATREEAERVLAKAKAGGVDGVVLAL